MNVFNEIREMIAKELDRLAADGVIPAGTDTARVSVEPPRDAAHGDVSTNAARASILSPRSEITSDDGPMKVIPSSSHRLTKEAFSARKPYPG